MEYVSKHVCVCVFGVCVYVCHFDGTLDRKVLAMLLRVFFSAVKLYLELGSTHK